MEELILMLRAIRPLSPALEAHLRSIIRRHIYRKGELLLQVGEVARDIVFLRKGLVRSYYLIRGDEVSNWFMKEGDIIISVLSFLRQVPSGEYIIALEACEGYGITYSELKDTCLEYPEFNYHAWIITAEYYCRSEERHQAMRRQTPEDKYKLLLKTDPDLVSRVSYKGMASFLNISLRTFCRIRKDIAEGRRR